MKTLDFPTNSELSESLSYFTEQERAELDALLRPNVENLTWRDWLATHFPRATVHPMPEGGRHARLWEWFEALAPGSAPPPRLEVWSRGGAKSTTGELATTRLSTRLVNGELPRRYVLYVSGVQEQADKHVAAVAGYMETIGVQRALNVYGVSKGWKRQELRTAGGFNVTGYGLDTGVRGVKLDNWRPDLLIFDDLDSEDDSRKTVEKKILAITTAILPAGSEDCAVLFLQNKIHRDSIVSQLCDNTADFLYDREPAFVEPAVRNLKVDAVERPDGGKIYRIDRAVSVATWDGQSLDTCESQINKWGLGAFKREAQHEVEQAGGYFFDVGALNYCDADEVPVGDLDLCRAWDLAATEGGGDHTAGPLAGKARGNGRFYVLDVQYEQFSSEKVRALMLSTAQRDKARFGRIKLHLPQDPGQAGKDQAEQLRTLLLEFSPVIEPVTGAKWVRARGFAEQVNRGNVWLVRAPWNVPLRAELRDFREGVLGQEDDIIDGLSDAANELAGARPPVPLPDAQSYIY